MSRALADIATGVITDLIVVADHMAALPYRFTHVDITDIMPAPQAGWYWNGAAFSADPPAPNLLVMASDRIAGLRAACSQAIMGGFPSSALGTPHTYPSTDTDQQNLSDAATAAGAGGASGFTASLWCADDEVWVLAEHTALQAQQVMADWIAFRTAQQQALADRTANVRSATNAAAIADIAWI